MAETWPGSLQDLLNEENFSFSVGETVIRTDMDIGPAKVRRRTTKSIDKLTGSVNLTTAQFTVFYDFYDITLDGGVNTFMYDDPITGVATEYRFTRPPEVRSLGGGQFRTSFEWEKIN